MTNAHEIFIESIDALGKKTGRNDITDYVKHLYKTCFPQMEGAEKFDFHLYDEDDDDELDMETDIPDTSTTDRQSFG